jgi:hypothetical protein
MRMLIADICVVLTDILMFLARKLNKLGLYEVRKMKEEKANGDNC